MQPTDHRGRPTGSNHVSQPMSRPTSEWQSRPYGMVSNTQTRKDAQAADYQNSQKLKADRKAKQDAEWEAEQKSKKK